MGVGKAGRKPSQANLTRSNIWHSNRDVEIIEFILQYPMPWLYHTYVSFSLCVSISHMAPFSEGQLKDKQSSGLHLVLDVAAWFLPVGKHRPHRPGRLQDDDARVARLRGTRPGSSWHHVSHGVQFYGGGGPCFYGFMVEAAANLRILVDSWEDAQQFHSWFAVPSGKHDGWWNFWNIPQPQFDGNLALDAYEEIHSMWANPAWFALTPRKLKCRCSLQ